MRILKTCLLAVVPSLAIACGGGSEKPDALIIVPDAAIDAFVPDVPPDAQVFDFSCVGNAAPTTATATVVLSGAANSLELNGVTPSFQPLPVAVVNSCKGDCLAANKLDTTTSGVAPCPTTGCEFTSAALTTGGVPLDGYVKVSKANTHRTTNVFPASPIVADQPGIPALAFSNNAFAGAVLFLQVTQDAGNGNLGILVTDCANTPINGASVTAKQNGTSVGEIVDAGVFSQMAGGTFIVFNVPPGDTEVGATFMGMTLRAHTIVSFAGETSATQIKPGF